jgi:hypothetical protein
VKIGVSRCQIVPENDEDSIGCSDGHFGPEARNYNFGISAKALARNPEIKEIIFL